MKNERMGIGDISLLHFLGVSKQNELEVGDLIVGT
jgi:hypothetical protein